MLSNDTGNVAVDKLKMGDPTPNVETGLGYATHLGYTFHTNIIQ